MPRPSSWRQPSWPEVQALRAAPVGGGPPGPPFGGRGRPGRPRWTTNGSSHPSRGTGRGQAPLCWSGRAHERARRRGSSSATAVTALHSMSHMQTRTYDPLSSHITAPDPPSPALATLRVAIGAHSSTGLPRHSRPAHGRPARTPAAPLPDRNTQASPYRATHPGRADAGRPGARRPPVAPPESACRRSTSVGTRCRSSAELCGTPLG